MHILAWQYAESEPGLAERIIDFVLNAAGQKAACAEFELNLELKNNPSYRRPPQGTARVRIHDVNLRPAADPSEARMESVAFDVDICIPGPKR